MLTPSDINALLAEYLNTPEGKKIVQNYRNKTGGSDCTKILNDIRSSFVRSILNVIPTFKTEGITAKVDRIANEGTYASVRVDTNALRRESLHYTTANGSRGQGRGIDDILSLFTHGYTLRGRVPYGIWNTSSGRSVFIHAKSYREPNDFLAQLCEELNQKYQGVCTITLNDQYK